MPCEHAHMSDQLKPRNDTNDIQMIQRFSSTWKASIGGMENVSAYFHAARTKLVELHRYYDARLQHCLFLRQEIADCVSMLKTSPKAPSSQQKACHDKILQYRSILRMYNREIYMLAQTQLKQIDLLKMHADDRLWHKRNEKRIFVDCRTMLTGRLEEWPSMCEILDCEQMVTDMITNLTDFSVYFASTHEQMNVMVNSTQSVLNAALDDVFYYQQNVINVDV